MSPKLRGFYYPQLAGAFGRRILRFNPKNLGRCAGGCIFCQRAYNLPTKPEIDSRRNWSANDLLKQLEVTNEDKNLPKVEHALVVTEFYQDNEVFLSLLDELKGALRERGFQGTFSSLASELRTAGEFRRYHEIVDGHDYCFTLECFGNRNRYMSPIKGIELPQVVDLLRIAKELSFGITFVNYIAGLDDINLIESELPSFVQRTGIDAIGLNVYTPYTDGQACLGHPEAKTLTYYIQLANLLRDLGVWLYLPVLYERSPAVLSQMWGARN